VVFTAYMQEADVVEFGLKCQQHFVGTKLNRVCEYEARRPTISS